MLEGVLGEPFTTQAQTEEVFQSEWRFVRDRLPASVRAQLLATPPPLGLSADQWGAALAFMVMVGTYDSPEPFAERWLLKLLPEATDDDRAELRAVITEWSKESLDAISWRLHEPVTCHELRS